MNYKVVLTLSFLCAANFSSYAMEMALTQQTIGNTPLMWAAKHNNIDMVDALIKAGTDVNKVNKYGTTALMCAIERNNADMAMRIMNPTPKPFIRKKIETFLMFYDAESCLSELPKELLRAVITCAYPEYAMDHVLLRDLPSRVLVDSISLERLSLLIKDEILDQKSILAAWQQKIAAMIIASKIDRNPEILQFETDVLKKIETFLIN